MSKPKTAKQTGNTVTLDEAPAKGDAVIIHAEYVESPGDKMLAVIEKASIDTRCNVDKMRALLDMKLELVREERRVAYNRAMMAAQRDMVPIVRKSWNENTKSYFAKLEHVDKIVRPIYGQHGFSLTFDSHKEPDGSITMLVDVLHEDGHEKRHQLNAHVDDKGPKGAPNKTQPQGVMSTASILQRKLTVMVFNLTFINEDDDGQGGIIEKRPDRFAGAPVAEQPITPLKKPLSLDEAAKALSDKLSGEEDLTKRGEILMKYLNVVGALEEAGRTDEATQMRELAEGKSA